MEYKMEWIKSFRLSVCLLEGLLVILAFHLSGQPTNWVVVIAMVIGSMTAMLQNDWRDRYHDIRKNKTLASDKPRVFLTIMITFWLALLLFTFIVITINHFMGMALIAFCILTIFYSETRKIPMLPIVIVVIAFSIPVIMLMLVNLENTKICLFSISVILVLFGRELSKDISDVAIDFGYKQTIPLMIGTKKSMFITITLIIVAYVLVSFLFPVVLISAPFILFGVIKMIHKTNLKLSRLYLDIGFAIAIVAIIIIY